MTPRRSGLRRLARSPLAVVVALVVVAVAAALAVAWFGAHRTVAGTPASDAAPAVKLARAAQGAVDESVAASGRIGPPAGSDAKLAFALPGIVAAVDVRVGDRVAAGERLASIARGGLASGLAQARADAAVAAANFAGGTTSQAAAASAAAKLDVASAHLSALQRGGEAALSDRISAVAAARQAALKVEQDRRGLARAQTLFAGGVSAGKDVEAAASQLDADLADARSADAKVAAAGAGYASALREAQANVAQAQSDFAAARAARTGAGAVRDSATARVASAERDYENGILRAPSEGVVVAVLKRPGEAVDPTTPVLDVAPPQNRSITLQIPGDDARRIRVGNVASLRLTGANERARGRVVAVVPAVDPTTQATTVVVDGVPEDAVAGEAVSATIVVGRVGGVLVPTSAIVTDPQTAKNVVFVRDRHAKDTPFVSREVELAGNDGAQTVIRSGLRAGEMVAAQGAYDLLAPSGS